MSGGFSNVLKVFVSWCCNSHTQVQMEISMVFLLSPSQIRMVNERLNLSNGKKDKNLGVKGRVASVES